VNMWPFDVFDKSDMEKENLRLHNEIKDLKAVIDEMFSREHESKAVYHYSIHDKEKKIEELEEKIADLQAEIDDLHHMCKRVKKSKNE
jgi:predicted RNase H-like nuclease (RuvC/YqgF family)